ncbi:hypothetical protein [Roseomonas elaeocarpi]|uniref:REase AHJR-like domain-containing protein n=1 Tax=Roseomonas elaeocarpi TaxID=907779 RepID=A0ABV6JWF2_9PROT
MNEFEREDAESSTLIKVGNDFISKGYDFLINPSDAELPDFLKPYRPDALAISKSGEDKVIIEIKGRNSRRLKVPLTEIDSTAANKSGWRYLLIYTGQDPSDIIDLPRPSKSQIKEALGEVKSLSSSGYSKAAILEGWSILEALARSIYPANITTSLRPLPSSAVIERLAMDGQIDSAAAEKLKKISSVRNSVAHGNLSVSVPRNDVEQLIESIESISDQIA